LLFGAGTVVDSQSLEINPDLDASVFLFLLVSLVALLILLLLLLSSLEV
jgi:hypothetical protein